MKKQYSSPQFTIEELQQEELLLQTNPVGIQNFDNNAGSTTKTTTNYTMATSVRIMHQ